MKESEVAEVRKLLAKTHAAQNALRIALDFIRPMVILGIKGALEALNEITEELNKENLTDEASLKQTE